MRETKSRSRSQLGLQLLLSVIGIIACSYGIWGAARVGYSRLLGTYASLTGNVPAANKAVALAPLDPQVHIIRVAVLYDQKQFPEAAKELERAVSLRPRDDYLWLELAIIRDEIGDRGALAAFNESVRLAPYYAHPSWQRGNFLLRVGRYAEAFVDLRAAAASNPDLVPNLIDLAWGISKANPQVAEEWAGINNDRMRLAFARFLAKQGKTSEALEQYRAAAKVSGAARRELMEQLIATGAFREAYEVWKGVGAVASDKGLTAIYDGGFDDAISYDDAAFGWRSSRISQGVRLTVDSNSPHAGSQSMRVQFLGYSDPATPLLSQYVLVEPNRRYRVKFAARIEDLLTGAVPLISVNETNGDKKRLGQSAVLRATTTVWQTFSFDFRTEGSAHAIDISLVREKCAKTPCPIFGSLWLDSFSIEELG